MKSLLVGQRLYALVALFAAALVFVGFMGLRSSSDIVAGLKTVYEDRTVALGDLVPIVRAIRDSRAQFALGLQHAPGNALTALHDHPASFHADQIEKNQQLLDAAWKKYTATYLIPEEKKLVDEMDKLLQTYRQSVSLPGAEILRKGDYALDSIKPVFNSLNKLTDEIAAIVGKLVNIQTDEAKAEYEKALANHRQTQILLGVLIAGSLLVSGAFSWWLIRSITQPLNTIRDIVVQVEKNRDFTLSIPVASKDEVGQMALALNALISNVRSALSELLTSIERVGHSAAELAESSRQAAQTAESTSESTASMAAAVEQMTVSINHVGDGAREAHTLSTQAGAYSTQGSKVIESTINEINLIATTVRDVSTTIAQLGEDSKRISSVIQVIKDVADQTNLLALNAAIEAARAGESGRGFAVVADEVRKLAERTANATGDISKMITDIQGSSHDAVVAMGLAVERVDSGVALAVEVNDSMSKISSSTLRVSEVVSSVSASILEQASASNSISMQVERVAQASEENSAITGNSSQLAGQVAALASSMRETASRFRI